MGGGDKVEEVEVIRKRMCGVDYHMVEKVHRIVWYLHQRRGTSATRL